MRVMRACVCVYKDNVYKKMLVPGERRACWDSCITRTHTIYTYTSKKIPKEKISKVAGWKGKKESLSVSMMPEEERERGKKVSRSGGRCVCRVVGMASRVLGLKKGQPSSSL